MSRINKKTRQVIHQLTVDTLRTMLKFHVSHKALKYIHDESTNNWRDLEDQLHNDYPIKGVGVKATKENLKTIDADFGGFLHLEEDLYPGEVPDELSGYPYDATSAAYLFTLLEGFGDDLVKLVNPGYLSERKAWHHGVYGDANMNDKNVKLKARSGFGKPFQRKPSGVPVYAVQRLVKIKADRNRFMHESNTFINFDEFFSAVIATVVFLHFFLLPNEVELSVYPYHDYNDKWG